MNTLQLDLLRTSIGDALLSIRVPNRASRGFIVFKANIHKRPQLKFERLGLVVKNYDLPPYKEDYLLLF